MTKQTLRFDLEEQTKGALRYQEVDENGQAKPFGSFLIGKIYFRKDKMPSPPPRTLTITVE